MKQMKENGKSASKMEQQISLKLKFASFYILWQKEKQHVY